MLLCFVHSATANYNECAAMLLAAVLGKTSKVGLLTRGFLKTLVPQVRPLQVLLEVERWNDLGVIEMILHASKVLGE